jgi:predicted dehydrogenase
LINSSKPGVTRRQLLAGGGAALAMTGLTPSHALGSSQKGSRMKLAIVGTGSRGSQSWGKPVVASYSDVVELVGLCDINSKRVQAAKTLIGTQAPTFLDFDRMVQETRPDVIMVTTVDSSHYRYINRAMELGRDVITEKPMCTDEAQCQSILDMQKKTGKKVTVTFNARYGPEDMKVKELLLEKAIGDLISVDFHEYLDTSHGADYFRRWHRLKENSGTLLVHKASHHFDQANWWLDSDPVEVSAQGDLKFYGRNHSFRSTHCRVCPFQQQCQFYWNVTKNPVYVKLYTDCESEDGYLRDGCVWAENTNIYDTMYVTVKYASGVLMSYTANTYLPYEGQAIAFNGTKGRLDYRFFKGGGFAENELRLTRSFGKSEVIKDMATRREGEHGGADTSLRDMIFRDPGGSDPLNLRADLRAGALASLVGIAAYRSIERAGRKVRIADLVKL